MKSLFDEDCDKLKRRLERMNARWHQGRVTPDAISVDVTTLEMLLQDHYDLLKLKPRR